MPTELLTMNGVSKRFGATRALSDVTLTLRGGEVHALIGENGAGKSTLMRILAGIHAPDEGTMRLAGASYRPTRPADARLAGIGMIQQELNLAPHLTVEANIMLGQERHRMGLVRRRSHHQIARQALDQLSQPDLPLDIPVGDLPIAQQQLVEIARALASEARILVFDEPTSSLTEEDTEHLFRVIGDLRATGIGMIYISHFLEEVAQICDVYTVLRDGEVVGTGRLAEMTLDGLVRLMVGREVDDFFPSVPHQPGPTVLRVEGLSGNESPRDVQFELRCGEIFGLAGLVGSGRSELLRCIYGLDEVTAGRAAIVGRGRVAETARVGLRHGLGFVSEDRKNEGLAVDLSIADNMTLSSLKAYQRLGVLNLLRRKRCVERWLERIECRAAGPNQVVAELSGGNQQKIAIVRLLHQDADVLLLDEPTRGIDVGTKAEIYRLIGELAAAGKAILLVSSYLPELINLCDRIGVMCRGRLREIRPTTNWTKEEIMHVATGQDVGAVNE
ncbi:MAG: sugar ABC transporter ATP-binding protein [Pirellulales bacterium]